jgi:urease accessory protein
MSDAPLPYRLFQIADSAFPAGGFAHSAGLEAAVHHGEARTPARLEGFVEAHLWNVGGAALPFVAAAHDDPLSLAALDAHCDAFLTSHVANRASRTQGRAFLSTCSQAFEEPALAALAGRARRREIPAHFSPTFGAALALLGVARGDTLGLFLFAALRGVASAAVRLGVIGPLEAARLQDRHRATLDAVLHACGSLGPKEAASLAPLLDIMGATHDRLYSRLFQS